MFTTSDNRTYRLKPISEWDWHRFPIEVVKTVSDAELAVARLDESAGYQRRKTALRRSLIITEAICSARIAGNNVTHRAVLSEGFRRFLVETESGSTATEAFAAPDLADACTSEVISLVRALHRTHKTVSAEERIDVEFFLDLQEQLARNAGAPIGLRTRPLAPMPFADGYFYPPLPEEVAPLLEEVIEFCNTEACCSTMVAAIAHFFFEAIVPFAWGNDRMGRLLSHAVYSRQHMWKNLVFPIGALPAIATKQHALSLLPYMTNRTVQLADVPDICNNWITYCGQSMRVSAHFANIYAQRIREMNDAWLARLGELRKDSAAHLILDELPTTPVFNVPYLVELTGKSFSSVNEAVTHLVEAGVVNKTSRGKRNRVFEASDVLDFYSWLEGQILPRNVNAREAYLSITQ
ncbi:Fic family protein [Eggerthella sinensis]|uniref:Fic family protein n=1 Tax=Eggerthella sinensis TaxID=242230 RepID=UPI00266CB60F|nr:Fic family protein [Eggerthella sinensis]